METSGFVMSGGYFRSSQRKNSKKMEKYKCDKEVFLYNLPL